MEDYPLMEAVGCLQYLAQVLRPDISFAVNLISRFCQNPGKNHWPTVLRYLKGTINSKLVYKKTKQ